MDKSLQYGGQLPLVTPATEERAAYNEIVQMYSDAFTGKSNTKIAILKSELRSEVVLGPGTNSIEWNVRADQPNPGMQVIRNTENRLDINDAFACRELSIQFGIQAAADVAGRTSLHTFENARVFPTASPAILTAYNGKLSMEVNTVKFMDGLGAQAFRYVDTAQQDLAVSTVALTGIVSESAANNKAPFVTMVPQFHVRGSDKTQFRLSLPDTAVFTESGFIITAVMILRGLRIQNGGTYRTASR
jgi:hypothetical protein